MAASPRALGVIEAEPPPQELSDNAHLVLITDLAELLPSTFALDFAVEHFELGRDGHLAVLVDNDLFFTAAHPHVELRQMRVGWHLVRAFLIHDESGQALPSPMAYVEAECFVAEMLPQPARPFLFGSPALTVLSPATGAELPLTGIFVDFWVTNCELSDRPHGYAVRIEVDDVEVATLRKRTALTIQSPPGTADVRVKVMLFTPAGGLVSFPRYNNWEMVLHRPAVE